MVLGVEKYGIYIYAYTIMNYFTLFVSYGFEYSATKKVSLIRDNHKMLEEIYSSIMLLRFIFNILVSLIVTFLVLFIPFFKDEATLYSCGVLLVWGQTIMPLWLYQGLEKMKFITLISFLSRLMSVLLIFALVRKTHDYSDVLLLQGLGYIIGAIISLYVVFFHLHIKFRIPHKKMLYTELKDGWYLFLSTIGMNFYRESNILLLGFFTNYSVVGVYAPAEKVIKAFQSLTSPFVNAIYPFFSRKISSNKGVESYYKIGRFFSSVLFVISLMLICISPFLVKTFLDESYYKSILDIQIMAFVILFGGMNFYYGIIGLVNMGYSKKFVACVWKAGFFSLVLCSLLSIVLKDRGAAISIIDKCSLKIKDGNGLKFKKNYKAVPDLVRLYLDKASEMLSDIRMSNEDKENKIILGSMITEEAFNKVKDMPIGLCVFSPPYANCFDYCEVYKLEFWIGGFVKSYDDFERFRSIALRSHVNSKFSHEFSNSNKDVDTIASLISSFNIWNKNIPDMIRGYFDDMESMIKNLSKILVNKAKCYIVVANSGYKGILVPTDLLLAEIAEKYGYKVCNIYHARKIRSSSQQMHILNTNYNNLMRESIIVSEILLLILIWKELKKIEE